jgi:hypothetical protein
MEGGAKVEASASSLGPGKGKAKRGERATETPTDAILAPSEKTQPEETTQQPPDGAAKPLDEEFVRKQKELGSQSCRGVSSPDLGPIHSSEHAVRVFKEMLHRERALAGEFCVFYHSYNSPALIYEVQAAVARVLFRFSARHGVLPRLLKSPFEKIPDAAAMLKAFPTWPDQDHNPAFKSVGICCSTSLVSHDPEATPTHVFLNGYGVSTVTIAVVEKLLRDCGTPKKHVSGLASSIMDLAKKHGLPQATGSRPPGHLLQIFIHRSCVDKWAYASLPFGVLDKSRQPLSKHLAKGCQMVGQARLVVNPSAFMRARSVRLHACSADPTFHKNRPIFQQELFDVLAPILGCPEVRRKAAMGIYGGTLPTWWKDIEDTELEADTEKSKADDSIVEADKAKGDDSISEASTVAPRTRCRYGVECRRQNPEHRRDYAHPGDADWDKPAEPTTSAALVKRPRCRYGEKCFRNGAEHRKAYAHPHDPDWDPADEEVANEDDLSNVVDNSCKEIAAAAAATAVEAPKEMASMMTTVKVRCDSEAGVDDHALCEPCNTEECGIESVPGLMHWLGELSVPQYFFAANEWANAQGACCLQEIVDDLEDFISGIGFKKLECKRVRKDGVSAMHVVLASIPNAT